MKVDTILEDKGRQVETVRPETSLGVAVHKLSSLGFGALVVSRDGEHLDGVISERDVVRGLAKHGAHLLELTVGDVMTKRVPICSPDDTLQHVMGEMTRSRQRHLPVVAAGKLAGVVSIGDVVKRRLEDMQLETSVLRDAYRSSH